MVLKNSLVILIAQTKPQAAIDATVIFFSYIYLVTFLVIFIL